jgi:C1A family cysteine protease
MRVIALLALVVAAFAAQNEKFATPDYHDSRHVKVFKKWQKHFGKSYASFEEEAHRFSVFTDNWKNIHTHNNRHEATYTLGLNQFADLNGDEFKVYVHGSKGSCLMPGKKSVNALSQKKNLNMIQLPASVDWTTKGVVTPVKNQGQCGSCWAFSTTGSIESRYAIAHGKLTSLSEQQLVDCSGSYGNMGCNGGLMDSAFKYVEASGGLCSESEYPYTARDGTCKSSSCGTKYDAITGYQDVTHESEQDLMAAVAQGPVSIAIEADQSSFQFYSGGVLTKPCGTRLDHGVLVVGYGEMSGQKYWKVKNSWGASWGEQGYIMLCRECNMNNGQGECGILDEPSYPVA